MQGKNENLLPSADKMRALQENLKVWSLRIQKGNSDTFFHFSKANNKEMVSSVVNPFWTIVPVEEQIIRRLEKPVDCFIST